MVLHQITILNSLKNEFMTNAIHKLIKLHNFNSFYSKNWNETVCIYKRNVAEWKYETELLLHSLSSYTMSVILTVTPAFFPCVTYRANVIINNLFPES